MIEFAVLDCRLDGGPEPAGAAAVHRVGPRPGKELDPLLAGRLLVLGDDADLAAVALRLLRRELLDGVEVGYAPAAATAFTGLWSLPVGAAAVAAAGTAPAAPVTLVRNDVGGVLVGLGCLGPVHGTVYVDEHRVLAGHASRITVVPQLERGLAVTVTGPRRWGGLRPGRSVTTRGRAVQLGMSATEVISDGVPYRRPMTTWIFYKHTSPLLVVGAAVG